MRGPVFHRSPRLMPELPQGEAEIPAPPPEPAPPHVSVASVLLYLLPGLLGSAILYLMARANGAQSATHMFYSLPMIGIGAVVQIGIYLYQKQQHVRALFERDYKYADLLQRCHQDLSLMREQQQRVLRETDPAPGEGLTRVEQRDPRMWERSAADPDFLCLRLGLGSVPFAVRIRAPRQDRAIDPDPLQLQAQDLAAQLARVDGVPIRLPLREVGVAGLAGPRPALLETARGLALQVAVHHSPDEVKLLAVFPAEEAGEWAWLRWLPHVWTEDRRTRLLAAEAGGTHRLLTDLYDLLKRRKAQQAAEQGAGAVPPLPALVCILAEPQLTEGEAVLPLLLREGQALGAYPVVLAGRRELLPKECRAIAEVEAGAGNMILTVPALSQTAFLPDETPLPAADRAARAMAPVRPYQMSAVAEVPQSVSLLDLLGAGRAEELDAAARWRESAPHLSLAVPIGLRAGGERLLLDLHERGHGPHGLVAGTTGSGKSELLQTLVASLAAAFHPHDLAFVMVDYKGGGMANVFRGLPHVIGTITNLDSSLAQRALAALKAELKRRQRLLGEAGVDHIDKYLRARRQGESLPALPHLVILVDEFAELHAAQPDFIAELVSTVRVGRSLGVHLILATQKPTGVVNEQIWSNTKFRICLRVERPGDSQEVIKRPDAAAITTPGRAYLQVGHHEHLELFQAGWGGAPDLPGAAAAAAGPEVYEVGLDGTRYLRWRRSAPPVSRASRSQLQAVVQELCAAAGREGIAPLPGPWLPPLPPEVSLEQVRPAGEGWDGAAWRAARGWLEPVVGLVDDPDRQRQEPLPVRLGREGHLSVYGAPGTGKTTFLQTLVTSLALTHSPTDLHIYLLDCSGRSLSLLIGFPHVGGVVPGDDTERVGRLLRLLAQELDLRKERLAAAGVNTLAAYRSTDGDPVPALVLAIDNYPALSDSYPDAEETLARVAREGATLGIHLVLTADSPMAVRSRVANNITMTMALQLADQTLYPAAVGRTNGLEPMPFPGRGLVKEVPPLEFQTCLPVAGGGERERSAALRSLMQAMDAAWTGSRPPPVRVLPEVVPLCEVLPPAADGRSWAGDGTLSVPLGLTVEDLQPLRVDLQEGPHFLIAGPPGCGKTTLLQAWLLALAESVPPDRLQIWLIDPGPGGLAPLRGLPQVAACVQDGAGLEAALDQIESALQERRRQREAAAFPALVIALDDYEACREAMPPAARDRLEQMVRRDRGLGLHLLAAGSAGTLGQGHDGLARALKELQTGFVLGSTEYAELSLFNLRLPAGESGKALAPGLGYLARRGRYRPFRAATAQSGELPLAAWVHRIAGRAGVHT